MVKITENKGVAILNGFLCIRPKTSSLSAENAKWKPSRFPFFYV